MATLTLPLVGVPNRRGFNTLSATTDQRFIGVLPQVVENPVTGNKTVYAEKRPGWILDSTPSSGKVGWKCYSSKSTLTAITAYYTSGTTAYSIYANSTLVGTISGYTPQEINETKIADITYYLINSIDGHTNSRFYYLASDSYSQTSYTGSTTSGSAVVTGIASTAGMYIGQPISGTGIPASTYILSVDSATQITMSANATATNAAVTITKTPLALVYDADYPDGTNTSIGYAIGPIIEMDGYLFVMTSTGRIYNSDLNSITSWSASGYIQANMSTDGGAGLARVKDQIIGLGTASTQLFYNAGNPSGSPLSNTAQLFSNIGAVTTYWGGSRDDSVMNIGGEYVAWLASINGQIGYHPIYIFDGINAKKISTPQIDRIFAYSNPTYGRIVSLSGFFWGGYHYIHAAIVDTTNNIFQESWLYCIELGIWVESGFPYPFSISGTGKVYAVSLYGTSGKLYSLPSYGHVYQDDGSAYTMTIQTARMNFGTNNWKFIKSVQLVCDKQASGTATLKYSDDDFGTWTTAGTFDLTIMNPIITRLGAHQGGRAYILEHNANTAFRAESLIIEYDIGQH